MFCKCIVDTLGKWIVYFSIYSVLGESLSTQGAFVIGIYLYTGVKSMTFCKDDYCVSLDPWTARIWSQKNASEFVI
jgi:hypothetical protein